MIEPDVPPADYEIAHELVLTANGIGKVFPGTVALDDVNFQVYAGAVNVVVGGNGAGKSTLIKILAGAEVPTSGHLELDGRPINLKNMRDASALGIGIIFQEVYLCPNLSVAENLFIGTHVTRFGVDIDADEQVARAGEIMARLEQHIDLSMLAGELRIGQQQVVEMAKALCNNVRILILDEPTSALSSVEVDVLFRLIGELKATGVAIVYVSHRLDEVMRIGDYVTVLRDGRVQAEAPIAEVSVPWIIKQMIGAMAPYVPKDGGNSNAAPMLVATDICVPSSRSGLSVDHVSLTVHAGEIVGIYGLMGAGRSKLFESLLGLHSGTTGSLVLDGHDVSTESPTARIRAGMALVPEDRKESGIIDNMTVTQNATLSSLWRFISRWSIDGARELSVVERLARGLAIKVKDPQKEITLLSGGNQQKVVIGKALLTEPKVILLDEPARGIDVGAKAEVFRTMRRLGEAGLAVLFATSDLHEVMAVADRILVMAGGRITAQFSRSEATENALIAASQLRSPAPLADVS